MSTTIVIEGETKEQLDYLVATGHYADATDAVQRAVDLLAEQEKLKRLRALIQVGIDEEERGEIVEYTPELRQKIREEARLLALSNEELDPDVLP
jgi:Arc/MetJ-type ribon-helix-helix transcriptional regulator